MTPDNDSIHVSITTHSWTAQMFYELPCLRVDLYLDVQGQRVKTRTETIYLETYNPTFPPADDWECCVKIENVTKNMYIAVTPIFDVYALVHHNNSIKYGIQTGDIWIVPTNTFNLTVKILSD